MAEEVSDNERSTKIYLDYNATTPLAPSVLQTIYRALRDAWGNPSSAHECGKKAEDIINLSRCHVARMIGAPGSDIVFTSGGTEANNMVFTSVVQHYENFINDREKSGFKHIPHMITSNIEHDSVSLAIENLKNNGGCEMTAVGASPTSGMVQVESILQAIQPNTCLVSIMMANNESGVIQPIREIVDRIKELEEERQREGYPKIFIHTDAAQAIGKIEVDVNELGVDYLTIVGHKFYGPRIGALYVKTPGKQTPLFPQFFGGGQERGYRPGTENTGMIAGLGEAARLVSENLQQYSTHMRKVRDHLERKLSQELPVKVRFNGKHENSERIPNTCNVSLIGAGLEGHRLLRHLTKTQASLGAACHSDQQFSPSRILLALGVPRDIAANALRVSIGRETTFDDIDVVVEDVKQAILNLTNEK